MAIPLFFSILGWDLVRMNYIVVRIDLFACNTARRPFPFSSDSHGMLKMVPNLLF
jgi:hypothetical protein